MRKLLVVSMTIFSLFIGQLTDHATEGGSSYYFPGASATFAVAVAPAPGFRAANQMLFYSGEASKAVLRGHDRYRGGQTG